MQTGPIMHVGVRPHAGCAFLGELGAGVALGLAAGLVRLAPLVPGGPAALLQARGGAARTGEGAGAGGEGRPPVEDAPHSAPADHALGPRDRTGLEELLLDAEAGEPVREVPDGLVVREVRLPHPALGLLPADAEADAVGGALGGHGEAGLVH